MVYQGNGQEAKHVHRRISSRIIHFHGLLDEFMGFFLFSSAYHTWQMAHACARTRTHLLNVQNVQIAAPLPKLVYRNSLYPWMVLPTCLAKNNIDTISAPSYIVRCLNLFCAWICTGLRLLACHWINLLPEINCFLRVLAWLTLNFKWLFTCDISR